MRDLKNALTAPPAREKLSRRQMLARLGSVAAAGSLAALFPQTGCLRASDPASQAPSPGAEEKLSAADEQLLDEIERAAFGYFWEQASSYTGLVKDRGLADGGADRRDVASTAATGFGLTALCIADSRGYVTPQQARDRVLAALRFARKRLTQIHGFYFHWLNMNSGERVWNSEVSSIDTTILLCGVLTCREHFDDPEVRRLATEIYERVDWPWLLNRGATLSHGWTPEDGFLKARWDTYCELMMIYLLGLGSPTHPLPAETWDAWRRPIFEYNGLRYIGARAPLFVHQYSHAWFDFRGRRDRYADYFENSIQATRAHRLFCLSLRDKFPDYSDDLWGITASNSAHGYEVWGGPPAMGPIDGTLVPAAPAGSIPFLPKETLRVLRTMREKFGERAWKRYAFVDAFNPLTKWYDRDVIGINLGIAMLMAENARTGFVWNTFMKNDAARRGMERAGFVPGSPPSKPERGPSR